MSIPLARPDVDTSPARGDASFKARVFVLMGLGTVGVLHIPVLAAAATSMAIGITYLALMLLCGVVAGAWRRLTVAQNPDGHDGWKRAHPMLVEDHRRHRAICAYFLGVAADQPEEGHRDRSRGRKRSAPCSK